MRPIGRSGEGTSRRAVASAGPARCRGRVAGPGRACGRVADQGQPDRGPGPTPAADLDGGGRQRPLSCGGRGRGAGAEPAVGDGDHDQDDAEPRPVATPVALAGSADRGGRGTFLVAIDQLGSAGSAFAVPLAVRSADTLPAVESESASPGLGHRGLLGHRPSRLDEVNPRSGRGEITRWCS